MIKRLFDDTDETYEWRKTYKPYMENGKLREDAPKEAKEAFEKYKAWAWEQPQ